MSAPRCIRAAARRRQARWLAVLLVLAFVPPAHGRPGERPNASGGPLPAEQAAFDVLAYDLTLEVDPEAHSIGGVLAMTARVLAPLDAVLLDLDDRLVVTAATRDGAALAFTHEGGRLRVALPEAAAPGEELTLAVAYGGEPRRAPRPPWDGGFTWARTRDGAPWIATSCQGEGADLWWPCKDHPSDKPERMDLHVTVPDGLVVASNGVLRGEVAHADGRRTFHWRVTSPISNYAVALNIAPYEVLEADYVGVDGGRFPFLFWVLPESVEPARAILPQFVDHMRFLEELLGPYPFRDQKYGIAETPHLGMEHQTIIAYGNRFRPGEHDYDWLHHHELSHEWWGNLVTCRDWKDMWVHEGFGTYMQALYLESRFGPQAYAEEMASKRALLNNRRAVAPRRSRDTKQIYFFGEGAFDNDIYMKGSWILHTLRWVLGDERFFEGLRRCAYPSPGREAAGAGAAVRLVDSEEIVGIFERVADTELDWFAEVYLRQPHLPRLDATWRDGRVHLSWSTPLGHVFPCPVPVQVGGEDGVRLRVAMPDGRGSFELPEGGLFALDPDRQLLRWDPEHDATLRVEPSPRVLLAVLEGCDPAQLAAAPTPVLDALVARGAVGRGPVAGESSRAARWAAALTGASAQRHDASDATHPAERLPSHPPFVERGKALRPDLVTAALWTGAPPDDRLADGFDAWESLPSPGALADRAVALLNGGDPDVLVLGLSGAGAVAGIGTETGTSSGTAGTAGTATGGSHAATAASTGTGTGTDSTGAGTGGSRADPSVVDRALGRVLAAVAAREAGGTEDWLVLVAVWPGADVAAGDGPGDVPPSTVAPAGGPVAEMLVVAAGGGVSPGPLAAPPAPADLAATALVHLGVEPLPEWGLDGRALTR